MKNAFDKLTKLRHNASRRNKVFIRRAIKAGWQAEGIIEAVKFGPQFFRIMGNRKS
jgi:hypothetical protein